MPNIELVLKKRLSSFRKIAIGTWSDAYDPSVYGMLELRMEEALRYLEEFRSRTGRKLTLIHMVGKAAAAMLKETPDANAILRWNKIYLRQSVGIFFHVVMTDQGEDRIDLSGATLYDLEHKSLVEICDEFQEKVARVRARQDVALEKSRNMFHKVPAMLLNWIFKMTGFLCYTLNLDLRKLGIPRDPFGSMMITNIGSLGLEAAYVPLVPYSHVPLYLALGAVKDEPVVEDGKIQVGKVLKISATFDHRIIDGYHAAKMAKSLKRWMENPYDHFDRIDTLSSAS